MGCWRRVALELLSVGLAWGLGITPALAQHDMHMDDPGGPAAGGTPALPKYVADPIPIYTAGLGPFTKTITTTNPEAQALFTQGMQMMYSFAKLDAVRSFRAAWQRDAGCAICYWGEAWAWGSYLNGPMLAEHAPFAYAAAKQALALKANAKLPWERAFIDAIQSRYVERFDPKARMDQERAYAAAMQKVAEAFPTDVDAITLYGDALFLLEPRRGTRDINAPNIQRLHKVLLQALALDLKHPGACHLYVHATESTVDPGRAAECAEFLGNAVPGASHMNHMPSHTWNEIGRWNDGVRANLQAWHSDMKAAINEGFAIYPDHNLHMLLFAASNDSQGAVAIQAGKDYAKSTGDSMYHVLTLVRFGRFDEIPAVTARPERDVPAGMWDFAQGYAKLRAGEMDYARLYLSRVQKAAATSKQNFRNHEAKVLLGIVGNILEGEIARYVGDRTTALAKFQDAVTLDDSLEYDEPEPLPFDARHWLGAMQIEAGQYAEAETTYRTELKEHPHNGWSLLGLQQALKAQGKPTADVDQELEKAWARSDTWIRASRF
ncbi:MAG: tetratricopeptide repeat protein [Vicinamibacterales bacterium]